MGLAVRNGATARSCRAQLELGGHNPLIVAADAELDRAVEGTLAGAFWSAGQKCTGTRRVYVHSSVLDSFREKRLARIAAAKVGDPADPETEVGPVVNEGSLDEILAAVARAVSDGGTVLAGGARADDIGYLIEPTLLEGVPDGSYLACNEVFGPVTSLFSFETVDEALVRANAVEFGLGRDLHPQPPRCPALLERAPGRDPPRDLADRRRRRPRAVRRSQGKRV